MSKLIKIQHAFQADMIHILVYTTGVCNYNCQYCSFGSLKNTRFMDLNALYDFLVNLYDIKRKKIYVELIGGEPTLDKNILQFAQKIHKLNNLITIGIYTNFSQDLDLYVELAKCNVDLTLTWHAIKLDKHNNQFIKNAIKLLDKNINNNIDIHVMYEKYNISESINAFNILVKKYPYNVELCLLDRDFSNNKIYFLENTYYTNDELLEYNKLIKSSKYGDNKKIYKATYDDGTSKIISVHEIQNSKDGYNFKYWKCDAGDNYMYIDITGNIYPCQCYFFSKINMIGNIYNAKNIKFKGVICKYNNCPCAWEAYKEKIFNNKKAH